MGCPTICGALTIIFFGVQNISQTQQEWHSVSSVWERSVTRSHERRLFRHGKVFAIYVAYVLQTCRLHTMVASSPEKYFSRMSLDVTSGGQSTHGKFTSVARDLYVVVPGPMIWLGDRITFGVINQGTQWTKFHIGVKRAWSNSDNG